MNAVITLNNKCVIAVRFAETDAPIEANNAVEVVPIFWPITKYAACSKSIAPVNNAANVVAIAALDACIMTVITVPIKIKMITPNTESD